MTSRQPYLISGTSRDRGIGPTVSESDRKRKLRYFWRQSTVSDRLRWTRPGLCDVKYIIAIEYRERSSVNRSLINATITIVIRKNHSFHITSSYDFLVIESIACEQICVNKSRVSKNVSRVPKIYRNCRIMCYTVFYIVFCTDNMSTRQFRQVNSMRLAFRHCLNK